jgi:hypothetical protein
MPRKITLADLIARVLTAPDTGPVSVDPTAAAQARYKWATDPIPAVQPVLEAAENVPAVGSALKFGGELFAPSYVDLATAGVSKLIKKLSGGADTLADLARLTTYHGTPHQFPPTPDNPLGAFDASKIGTGEGEQAYGYGLYLAETPRVAETYAGTRRSGMMPVAGGMEYAIPEQALSELQTLVPPQNQSDSFKEGFQAYLGDLISPGVEDRPDPSAIAQTVLKNAWRYTDDETAYQQGVMEAIQRSEPILQKVYQAGSLYTADLPDAMIDKMLDWDKPLNQQTSAVVEALNKLPPDVKAHLGIGKHKDLKGGIDIYQPLGGLQGDAAASELLRKAGIVGIKYLDKSSRGIGKGSRNFVVFPGEESNVKILKRE